MQPLDESSKHILDLASTSIWVGSLIKVLPAIAALVSIVWGCIRIYETRTVQKLLGRTPKTRKEDRE